MLYFTYSFNNLICYSLYIKREVIQVEKSVNSSWLKNVAYDFGMILQQKTWLVILIILGPIFHIVAYTKYRKEKANREETLVVDDYSKEYLDKLRKQIRQEEKKKDEYLKLDRSEAERDKRVEEIVQDRVKQRSDRQSRERLKLYSEVCADLFASTGGFILALVLALPMTLVMFILSSPIASFIVRRVLLMLLVIMGVVVVVFTLLYLSPSDPARNILGEQATLAEVENFRELYGLNDSYLTQLFRSIVSVFTFDFGNTFQGNVSVMADIFSRFPITLTITFFSLIISLLVALPAGIYAGINPNTKFDYVFMFFALIGVSMPTFWLGLLFILTFSVELGVLPATYSPIDNTSLIMPVIVLGVTLMAAVSRMARSSTLEVINEDYIMTAQSKGLSRMRVIMRHVIPNALIPVITIVGLQFSVMLGGSAVTEQVFTIPGIGSYIVEKQFLPDVPAVLGGVVYVAVVLSIVNLFIDILYSFIDPRIRTKIQNGQIK